MLIKKDSKDFEEIIQILVQQEQEMITHPGMGKRQAWLPFLIDLAAYYNHIDV